MPAPVDAPVENSPQAAAFAIGANLGGGRPRNPLKMLEVQEKHPLPKASFKALSRSTAIGRQADKNVRFDQDA
jgi:hypothetical protein